MDTAKPAEPIATPVDLAAVCGSIRAALAPARVHATSLHDAAGDPVWLSESAMGPDEHEAVREAFESYANPNSPVAQAFDLGDARSAVIFRLAGLHRGLVGAAMIIVDTRTVRQDARGAVALMNPRLQQELAAATALLEAQNATPAPSPAAPTVRPPGRSAGVDPPPAQIERLHAALRRASIALHVQRLVPLARGSRFERYEVLLRFDADSAPDAAPRKMLAAAVENGFGSMIDRRVVTELIGWLKRHPAAWLDHGALFAVNLTTTSLHDEHFLKFVELCLAKADLPPGTIGFQVKAADALLHGSRLPEVAACLRRAGCPLVLTDFGLRGACLDLLRLPGVQAIKIDPELTARMRVDKLSQAMITALVQIARVLGMHTVAQHGESSADRQWLTALGIDFIQSRAVAPPLPIDALDAAAP
ncbi:MAG TPA: EAL domain-containing protein [Steroidobacteraceae bacterium]|nr:EAL domain-containing protein [Steroidobacteraceae bacterium]